jgi:hypothetical protein
MMRDIDALVASLIGEPAEEIQRSLMAAASGAEHWKLRPYGRSKETRERQERRRGGARPYAAFASGALFMLFYSDGRRPVDVPTHDFEKLRPLVEDMVARGLRPPEFLRAFDSAGA